MNYNQNSGYGMSEMIRATVQLPVMGKILFVCPSADPNYERLAQMVKPDHTGDTNQIRLYQTVEAAYAAMTNNAHDVMVCSAYAGHALTAMLDVSKSRCHFIGMSGRDGALGIGARCRWTMGETSAATDLGVMKNTGVGNTFTGIKFDSSNIKAESLYGIVEAGEYAIYKGCEIYKSSDLNITGAAEIAMNGDSAQFIDCYIGSTANIIVGAILRPCVLLTGGIVSGKKCRDSIFKNCTFGRKAGNEANRFVYGANATDVERMLQFQGCTFFNNPLSAATPGVAIEFGAAQTEGAVFCDTNCAAVDVTVLGKTGQNIFVISQDGGTYATAGLAVAS